MDERLAAYLAGHRPVAREEAVWVGASRLVVATYVGLSNPPEVFISSARCLLFAGDTIMVLRNRDSTHIVPGGRREPGEAVEATLYREVLEETGWTIVAPRLIGVNHFLHLDPQHPDYRQYPYPDFLHAIYWAEAGEWRPWERIDDDYELEAGFQPIAAAQQLPLTRGERAFLAAALRLRASRI